jgi:alkanesulfonate monooxygenase SsuD/methylene tetrahydromethanopterin reductase-like flavin-dependent oxidoreductase (luciferase family)
MLQARAQATAAAADRFDFDNLVQTGQALIGTPDQVGERLVRNMERAGTGIFMGLFQIGDTPHARTMRNIELFAEKVMPHLPLKTRGAATPR